MPLAVQVHIITPDDDTYVVVGPEGILWEQPAIGAPVIPAARSEDDRAAVASHVADLLAMGLMPYGLPLDHRRTLALFGGPVLRDCEWVPWGEAPAPAGDPGDVLPTTYVAYALPPATRTEQAGDLITITDAAALLGISTWAISQRIRTGTLTAYDDPNEPNPQRRKRVRRRDVLALPRRDKGDGD